MSLPPKVRELIAQAERKLRNGETVKGARGAAQRQATKAELRATREARKLHPCKCNCGELCKGEFARGHTARYYQRIRAYVDGDIALEELSPYYRRICITRAKALEELGGRYGYAKPEEKI